MLPYFNPKTKFKQGLVSEEQPKVRARFSKQVRLSVRTGEMSEVGQEYEVPLDLAHSYAHCILPEPKEPKPLPKITGKAKPSKTTVKVK